MKSIFFIAVLFLISLVPLSGRASGGSEVSLKIEFNDVHLARGGEVRLKEEILKQHPGTAVDHLALSGLRVQIRGTTGYEYVALRVADRTSYNRHLYKKVFYPGRFVTVDVENENLSGSLGDWVLYIRGEVYLRDIEITAEDISASDKKEVLECGNRGDYAQHFCDLRKNISFVQLVKESGLFKKCNKDKWGVTRQAIWTTGQCQARFAVWYK